MITLDDPDRHTPRAVLDSAGGFAWWYAEILDANGTGIVVIWSFGLPFLPGYLDASRTHRPQRPGARPSVNVCVYDEGQLVYYVLREYDPQSVSWTDGVFRFGETTFEVERGNLRATLNVALEGSDERLMGSLELSGAVTPTGTAPARDEPRLDPARVSGPRDRGTAFIRRSIFAGGRRTCVLRPQLRTHAVRCTGNRRMDLGPP